MHTCKCETPEGLSPKPVSWVIPVPPTTAHFARAVTFSPYFPVFPDGSPFPVLQVSQAQIHPQPSVPAGTFCINFIPISTPLGFFTLRSTRILFPAPPRMGQPALRHLSSAKTTQLLSFFRMNYLIPQLCYLPLQSIQGWRLHGKCCTE